MTGVPHYGSRYQTYATVLWDGSSRRALQSDNLDLRCSWQHQVKEARLLVSARRAPGLGSRGWAWRHRSLVIVPQHQICFHAGERYVDQPPIVGANRKSQLHPGSGLSDHSGLVRPKVEELDRRRRTAEINE